MKKQEDFYDILRSKFIERDVPANEGDWREMRKMIDDSRKKNRRIAWGVISFAWLLLGLGVFELSSMNNHSKNIVAPANAQPLAENSAPVSTGTNSVQPANTASAKEETKPIVRENTRTSSPSIKNNKIPKSLNKPISKPIKQEVKVAMEVAIISSVESYKTSSKSNEVLPGVAESKSIQSSEVKLPNNAPDNRTVAIINNTEVPSSSAKKEDEDVKKRSVSDVVDKDEKTEAPITSQNTSTEVTNSVTAQSKSDSLDKKTKGIASQASTLSAAPLPPLKDTTPCKNSFSIEAGAGYSLGWKYTDTTQGRGINATIGLGYTRMISPKFSVKTGLQLSSLGNMGTSPFTIKHVSYDFGYNANDTSLITKWLYYLTIPIQVEYKLGQKNAIGAGGTVSYLVIGSGKVDAYTMSGNTVSGNNSEYSQFMTVKGYNRWNSSIFLLYKRTLFKNFSAYLIPYYGLIDIKNNSFFGQNKFERDLGVKLILSYTIL